MFRAYFYLLVSAVIWFGEGLLFSHYLGFAAWQIALLGVLYLALFALALRYLLTGLRESPASEANMTAWRVVSLAPMLVTILGSFASLPLIILVAAAGKI
jgi:hypothetical protein